MRTSIPFHPRTKHKKIFSGKNKIPHFRGCDATKHTHTAVTIDWDWEGWKKANKEWVNQQKKFVVSNHSQLICLWSMATKHTTTKMVVEEGAHFSVFVITCQVRLYIFIYIYNSDDLIGVSDDGVYVCLGVIRRYESWSPSYFFSCQRELTSWEVIFFFIKSKV